METSARAYQLARKLHRQTNTLNYSHPQLQDYPAYHSKLMSYPQPPVHNIFKDNAELRIRKLEIEKDRQYEITGAGAVLKIDHIKNKKKKDAKNRNGREKDTILTNKSSRESLIPFAGSIYLTKDQVLHYHSPQTSLGMRSAEERSEFYWPIKRQNMAEIQKHNNTCNSSPNQSVNHDGKSKNFSVSKLKQRLLQYKAVWSKQKNRRKQGQQVTGNLKRRKMAKLWDSHRDNKQRGTMNERVLESNFSWMSNLRQECQKEERGQMSAQIMECSGLNIEGRSKLKKQISWIEQKHSKGYFFYRHSNINSSQLSYIHQKLY